MKNGIYNLQKKLSKDSLDKISISKKKKKKEIKGINISTKIIEEFPSIYVCKKGEWPNMYQGLPLKGNHKSFSFWKIIIENIGRRLSHMVIMLYFKWSKTHPNTSHLIQHPHILHVSI